MIVVRMPRLREKSLPIAKSITGARMQAARRETRSRRRSNTEDGIPDVEEVLAAIFSSEVSYA